MSDTDTEKQKQAVEQEQPRYYEELVEQLLSELETFFGSHMEDMFKLVGDYLFEASQSAHSIAEQNDMLEGMHALEEEKQNIQKGFVDGMSFFLQPVSELEQLPEKKQSTKPTALSLVEQNEMDVLVTIKTISSKAASDNAESIDHLRRRLKELGQYNDHIFHGEALEPGRICEAMHEALGNTRLSDEQSLVVYRFFDQALIRHLSKLYDSLNNLLIENNILPEIYYTAPSYEHHEEFVPPDSAISHMGADQSRRAFGSGIPNYAARPGGPGAGAGFGTGFGAGGAGGAGAGTGGMPGVADAGAAPVYGPAGQSHSAGVPVPEVRQSIQNFVGGTYADMTTTGTDQYYSHQQVMTALTGLQQPAEDLRRTPLVFDANQIKKAVLSSIGETEGGAVTKSVNQVSEKTIDFIKLIFDAIIDEDSITDEIKTLLLSLQIPVIKAAMLDSEFFVDDHHPARQLLDKIAEAGVGVTEHTDPVYIEIEQVVRKLLNEYNEDIVAFTVALESLKELTEEIYRKARENEEKSQQTIKMAHAKNTVLQEIRKITIGKELPMGIRTLVLKVWPSMMYNHYMSNGKANDEWVELLMILQKIIESVQPLNTLQDLEELGLTHNDILKATSEKLEKVSKNKRIIGQVVDDLAETYKKLMATTGLPGMEEEQPQEEAVVNESEAEQQAEASTAEEAASQVEPVAEAVDEKSGAEGEMTEAADAESIEALEAEAEVPTEPELDPEAVARAKIEKLPDGVTPGGWFIVYNGEDKPVRRLKLAVILVQDATMVFVDHLGNVVIEKDAAKFADELDKGLSGIIMQHSVFDHALHSALQTIEH